MIVDLKRCLSILLAVMLLVGIIPTAYAADRDPVPYLRDRLQPA